MADLISAGLAPAFVGLALMSEWSVTLGGEAWQAWWVGVPLWVLPAAAWRWRAMPASLGRRRLRIRPLGWISKAFPHPWLRFIGRAVGHLGLFSR